MSQKDRYFIPIDPVLLGDTPNDFGFSQLKRPGTPGQTGQPYSVDDYHLQYGSSSSFPPPFTHQTDQLAKPIPLYGRQLQKPYIELPTGRFRIEHHSRIDNPFRLFSPEELAPYILAAQKACYPPSKCRAKMQPSRRINRRARRQQSVIDLTSDGPEREIRAGTARLTRAATENGGGDDSARLVRGAVARRAVTEVVDLTDGTDDEEKGDEVPGPGSALDGAEEHKDSLMEEAEKDDEERRAVDFDDVVHKERPSSGNKETGVEDSHLLQLQTEGPFDLFSQFMPFAEGLNNTAFNSTDGRMDTNNGANNSGHSSGNNMPNQIFFGPPATNLAVPSNVQPRDLQIRNNNENFRLPVGAKWVTDQWGQIIDIIYADGSLWSAQNPLPAGQSSAAAAVAAPDGLATPDTTGTPKGKKRQHSRTLSNSPTTLSSRRQKPNLSMALPVVKLSKEEQEQIYAQLIAEARNATVKPTTVRTPNRPVASPITPRAARTAAATLSPATRPQGQGRLKGKARKEAKQLASGTSQANVPASVQASFTAAAQAPIAPQAPQQFLQPAREYTYDHLLSYHAPYSGVDYAASSNELLRMMGDMSEMDQFGGGGYGDDVGVGVGVDADFDDGIDWDAFIDWTGGQDEEVGENKDDGERKDDGENKKDNENKKDGENKEGCENKGNSEGLI